MVKSCILRILEHRRSSRCNDHRPYEGSEDGIEDDNVTDAFYIPMLGTIDARKTGSRALMPLYTGIVRDALLCIECIGICFHCYCPLRVG